MMRNVFLTTLLMLPTLTVSAQEETASPWVRRVTVALCNPNSGFICTEVNPQYVDVVATDLVDIAPPVRLDHTTLAKEYAAIHSLQQQANRDAGSNRVGGADEYLAHLYWERSLVNHGKARCTAGSVACYAIAGLLAAFGGPPGIIGGTLTAAGCYYVTAECTSKWENELYIIDRAIAEYDKCPQGDKACYKAAFEKKNIKPAPLPSPMKLKQEGAIKVKPTRPDGSDIGGTSGGSTSGPGGIGGSGWDGASYRCYSGEITINGKMHLTYDCFWG